VSEKKEEFDPANLFGGTLNFLGLKIDIARLLSDPESITGQLEELRAKLKAAGGRETLSDEEWRAGGATVSGQIRTRGVLGEREFHIGTAGERARPRASAATPEATEAVEPPTDVYDEAAQVVIVADVPGIGLEDLELKASGRAFSFASKARARRHFRKELILADEVEPESMQAECRNGVLEVRLRKQRAGEGGSTDS